MTIEDNNVVLMISKKGFRHSTHEQRFIASQIDWVYTRTTRRLAILARSLMALCMVQVSLIERDKRSDLPFTKIVLTLDKSKLYTAIEEFTINNDLVVSLIPSANDNEILDDWVNSLDRKVTTLPSDLSVYLKSVASDEIGTKMANGGSFSDFLTRLGELIEDSDKWLVPAFMTYDNNDEKHEFSITLVTNENKVTDEKKTSQCLKIKVVLK